VLAFLIAFTTQYYIMVTAGSDMDYTDTLKRTFGWNGYRIGMLTYIMVLMIPITIFFSLLSQFLYPIIKFASNVVSGTPSENKGFDKSLDFKEFSYSWTCLIVFIYLFLITNRRDMQIFIRINTYGVLFTIIIIVFIAVVGF